MPEPVLPPEMWGLWHVDSSLKRLGLLVFGNAGVFYLSKPDAQAAAIEIVAMYKIVCIPVRLYPRDETPEET